MQYNCKQNGGDDNSTASATVYPSLGADNAFPYLELVWWQLSERQLDIDAAAVPISLGDEIVYKEKD
jgi:hypothetical protein